MIGSCGGFGLAEDLGFTNHVRRNKLSRDCETVAEESHHQGTNVRNRPATETTLGEFREECRRMFRLIISWLRGTKFICEKLPPNAGVGFDCGRFQITRDEWKIDRVPYLLASEMVGLL
jgi:hypothetical protein